MHTEAEELYGQSNEAGPGPTEAGGCRQDAIAQRIRSELGEVRGDCSGDESPQSFGTGGSHCQGRASTDGEGFPGGIVGQLSEFLIQQRGARLAEIEAIDAQLEKLRAISVLLKD